MKEVAKTKKVMREGSVEPPGTKKRQNIHTNNHSKA